MNVTWSLSVSKEIDQDLHKYLTERGLPKENLAHLVEKAVRNYIGKPESKSNPFDLSSVSVEEIQARGLNAFSKPISFKGITSESDPVPEQSEEEVLNMLHQIREESNAGGRIERLENNNGNIP